MPVSSSARLFAGYASPYALFLEAIGDMLRCDVTAALLEDACPLDDRLDLAGALRLQPRNGSARDDALPPEAAAVASRPIKVHA